MIEFNLDGLTREELVELHRRVVERLNFIDSVGAQASLLRLRVGQRVRFDAPGRGEQIGVIVKRNTKTASVLVGATRWTVAPHLLQPVESESRQGPVIDLMRSKA